MTTISYDEGDWRLRLEGHAEATADGIDPVCAGASALGWTLVEAATNREDYNAKLLIEPERALIDVKCSPTRESRKACRQMYEIILGGLTLLAEAYPDNVRIKEGKIDD